VEGLAVTHLLDTAPWINVVTMPDVLPQRLRRLLASPEPRGLCSISLLEAAILHRLGRLNMEETLAEFFATGLSADLRVLELAATIAVKTNDLGANFPGDPFDRTVVATAAALNLDLITTDPAIRDAKMCEVEYCPFKPSRARWSDH
jgi:PIN domain nuclease of toxin-antitoxin system